MTPFEEIVVRERREGGLRIRIEDLVLAYRIERQRARLCRTLAILFLALLVLLWFLRQ